MKPQHYHAVVWIDHKEARIVHFNADAAEEEIMHPHGGGGAVHLHCKASTIEGYRAPENVAFFRDVAAALKDAGAFLVAGPAAAKTEFVKFLHREVPGLIEHLAGIETLGRVTEPQLVAEARRYFRTEDRMRPQIV